MQPGHRLLLPIISCMFVLSGCKFGGISGSGTDIAGAPASGTSGGGTAGSTGGGMPPGSGGGAAPAPSGNSIVATPSVAGMVSTEIDARQAVSVTFTSSDGLAISGFAISGTTLPEGWNGPDVFTCPSASTGNDCVLNLTHAPTAGGSGSLTLNYIYVDHAGVRRTPGGSLTIPYAATTANHVTAAVSPSGQVIARVGAGTQTVIVNFTTDDGNAATALQITDDLATLPVNWRSRVPSFSCSIISTGNGCQLALDYSPGSAVNGTLTLHYDYVDNSGVAQSTAVNIPYSTASSGTVVATVSPAGQVNAIQKTGGQAVAVTFTTDDGTPASGLLVSSDLKALPAGWHSDSAAFRCGSVGTGNGCQLRMNYAPRSLDSGFFTLNYVYDDAGGTFKIGSVNIAYAATTDNNVTATASPSGQVNAVVGSGAQNVAVTFTSDDGRPATALALTSEAADLPPGWSGPPDGFMCTEVAAGSACQLNLLYTPGMADAGTLTLRYGYFNNAGKLKSGSVNIPYRATTDDNVVGTPNPTTVSTTTGSNSTVDISFTTDDGNPATGLTISSGLDALPAEWSSASSSFTCPALGGGTSCQLTLLYAPTVPAAGTVTLGFSYSNNSGFLKTGSTTITYSAAP